MFMVFGKKWPKKHVYLTKQFYGGAISIPWQLVTQLVQESLDISDARLRENVGKVLQVMLACRTGGIFSRILGEWRRKGSERGARSASIAQGEER